MTVTPQQKIIALYAAFGLCVITTSIPNMSVQNYAMLLTLVVLIAGYLLRKKSSEDSLESHHATFVIRTIWIWSAVLVFGMMGAGWMVYEHGDASAITTMANSIMEGATPTEDDMNQAAETYFDTNYDLIFKSMLQWLAPAQLYAVWRIARGLSRALKGYRVQNLRSWI